MHDLLEGVRHMGHCRHAHAPPASGCGYNEQSTVNAYSRRTQSPILLLSSELARHAHRTDSSFPCRSELLSSFGWHVLLAIRAAELARHAHRADSSFPCRSELLIEGSVEGVILVVRSCHMVSLRFVWVLLAVYAILIDLPRLQ